MDQRTILVLVLAGFVGRAQYAAAQATGSVDPLAIPHTQLLCRAVPSAREDPTHAAISLRFEEGDLRKSRLMDVAYDSTGAPVYLNVLAVWAGANEHPITYALVTRFGPGETVAGLRMQSNIATDTASAGSTSAEHRPPKAAPFEPLSAPEVSEARTLAIWLWDHRCLR